jgi:electron transport complex protein RnfB
VLPLQKKNTSNGKKENEMSKNIYQKLAHHLDNLPGGFPSTDSGVELRILRRLFSPHEAELALHLTLIPEEPRVIARRAKLGTEEAANRLEEMAGKGLIFRIQSGDRPPRYMNEYIPALFDREMWKKAPQLRTVPVGKSIDTTREVLTYENAEELVQAQKRFAVAPCICRREAEIMGNECSKPLETCLVFGVAADYYVQNSIGREIDLEEALDILREADKAGLVLQPSNAQKIVNICCCCGCCCQVLKSIKRYPHPATLVSTPFMASLDPATCKGCGTCMERCQMEALRLDDDKAVLDVDRCIGCGLCVSTCPTGSLTLVRKTDPEQKKVPRNMTEALLNLSRERGKLGPLSLAKMQIKSKLDRRLAAK